MISAKSAAVHALQFERDMRTTLLLSALSISTMVFACAAPASEQTRRTSHSLTTAIPVLRVDASRVAQKRFGISEWRVYRGKKDIVFTGYDAKGRAMKGVAIAFAKKRAATNARISVRVLDGSYVSGRHELGGATQRSRALGTDSAKFLDLAVRDLDALRGSFRKWAPRPGAGTTGGAPLPPLPPGGPIDPGACGGDLASMIMAALQCLMSGQADPMQCLAAAQGAGSSAGTCEGGPLDTTGQGPYDPSQCGSGMPIDPNDPYGGAAGGMCDPTQGMPPMDPSQYPGDDLGMGQCPSCPEGSGMDDIGWDPESGGVGSYGEYPEFPEDAYGEEW